MLSLLSHQEHEATSETVAQDDVRQGRGKSEQEGRKEGRTYTIPMRSCSMQGERTKGICWITIEDMKTIDIRGFVLVTRTAS